GRAADQLEHADDLEAGVARPGGSRHGSNPHSTHSNRRCMTDSPESRSSISESMPISRCLRTYFSVTDLSLLLDLTPSGVMGLSATRSSAPWGMWLTNPTMKVVAVSMSTPRARIFLRYSRKLSSCSQTRLLVV